MPGVIMENGNRNGSHTNHDRDQRPNGVNGIISTSEKGKGRAEPLQNVTPISPTAPNGLNGPNGRGQEVQMPQQVGQLPDGIHHFDGDIYYKALPLMIQRMAQKTHSNLLDTMNAMASMPLPVSVANGNGPRISSGDDTSVENIAKKVALLKFAEDAHADWTKALIITGWSRRAGDIEKLIDLREHLTEQARGFTIAYERLGEIRKNFYGYAVPNPDLKTAVEVLTTGKASWMPELNFIPPPPLTARETLKYIEELNTLLSIRLNLHDYDSIPPQFRNYTIQSGRVTFKVAGEFEVDLGMGTEDPQEQLYFVDFRFLCSPAPSTLMRRHRILIDQSVNTSLHADGLTGCYKLLHEMVLTHKIGEFVSQAVKLATLKWVETLKVERLNRAMSIQYWLDRYPKGPKSWILLGVHSGRRKDGRPDPKATSRLFLRWFRDGKEVKDVKIPFDHVNISAESLLHLAIAQHVNHILTSIHDKLRDEPLYANRELALSLFLSSTEPADSQLQVELTDQQLLSVKIEPITGRFVFSPGSPTITEFQHRLNAKSQDPAKDGFMFIEHLRCALIAESITSRGLTVGWTRTSTGPGLKNDVLQEHLPKDNLQCLWLRRTEWLPEWHLLVCLTKSGEVWKLISIRPASSSIKPKAVEKVAEVNSATVVPMNTVCPTHTYEFLSKLKVLTAGIISHATNLRTFHQKKVQVVRRPIDPPKDIKIPSIYIEVATLIPSRNISARTGKPWARDLVRLDFHGLASILAIPAPERLPNQYDAITSGSQPTEIPLQKHEANAVMVMEARLVVTNPQALSTINRRVDKNISFNPATGCFALRLYSKIGESIIADLVESVVRIERLVEFVQVLEKHRHFLTCRTVSIGDIVFMYGNKSTSHLSESLQSELPSHVTYEANIDFSAVGQDMQLKLQAGNPHLLIKDYLTEVLNSDLGLDGVASLLPRTLPLCRAFSLVQNTWDEDEFSQRGELFINPRAADAYMMCYVFTQHLPPNSTVAPKIRKVNFEIKTSVRKGAPWWQVSRGPPSEKGTDDLDEALKSLWKPDGNGKEWVGMSMSAVAQEQGTDEMIYQLNELIKKWCTGDIFAPRPEPRPAPVVQLQAPPQLQVHGQAGHGQIQNQSQGHVNASAPMRQQGRPPVQQMGLQQRHQQHPQQQPIPTHTQGSSQGHSQSRMVKREVVEID